MAQVAQTDAVDAAKWKLGSKCSLFDRKDRKWNEGIIVGSFSDENGEWIKVQCGSEIHDVLADDPDLRLEDHDNADILAEKIKEWQAVAMRRPDMALMINQTIAMSNELQSALQKMPNS